MHKANPEYLRSELLRASLNNISRRGSNQRQLTNPLQSNTASSIFFLRKKTLQELTNKPDQSNDEIHLRNNREVIVLRFIPPLRRLRTGSKPDILPSLRGRQPLRPRLVLRNLPREEVLLFRSRRLQLRPRVDILRRPRPRRRSAAAVQIPKIPGRLALAPGTRLVTPIIPSTFIIIPPRLRQRRLPLSGGGEVFLQHRRIAPGAALGDGLDPVAVNRSGVGVVLRNDVGFFGDGVLCEECVELVVAAGFHFLDLDVGPGVHGDRSDEGDVDAEATVLAGAFEAHEDAVGDGGPLRVLLGAVNADLVPGLGLQVPEPPRRRRHRGSDLEGRECG